MLLQLPLTNHNPVLESNDEVQSMEVDDPADDPVGRRIDDVPTTAQTFNVAGFGMVCDWSACPPRLRLPSQPLGRGCASSTPPPPLPMPPLPPSISLASVYTA